MGTDKKKKRTKSLLELLPSHLTYSAVIDAKDNEQEISDFMVRRACREIESEQRFPFAPKSLSRRQG